MTGRERVFNPGVLFFFAVTVAGLYHSVLYSYWLYDDPYILQHAIEYRPWQYFFLPDVWRKVSLRYLTPLLTFSFDLDHKLFGIQPQFFYLHQLFSLWLAAVMFYIVLRQWVRPGFAFMGGLLFLVTAPVAAASEMLQIRHYIEGLIFCLLAIYFFVKAIRKESAGYSILSSLSYLISMSAKELYVPFYLVFLFLPEGSLRRRIKYSLPSAIALMAYFIWRYWMLGDLIAGPGGESIISSYKGLEALGLFLKNIYGTVVLLSGTSQIGSVINIIIAIGLFILFAVSCVFLIKDRKYSVLFFFIVLFGAVYSAPLAAYHPYFISGDFAAYRLNFLIAGYIAMLVSVSSNFLYTRIANVNNSGVLARALVISYAGLLFLLVFCNAFLWISVQREKTLKPLIQEGKFFMQADTTSLLVKSDPFSAGIHYYANLELLRKLFKKEGSPRVVYDYFVYPDRPEASELRGYRVFKYNATLGVISEITGSYLRNRTQYLERIQKMPLFTKLMVDNGIIDFSIGPYNNSGRYFILLGSNPGFYSMFIDMAQNREMKTRMFTNVRAYWRSGWESPEGKITISPEWHVDFSKRQEFVWEQK